MNSHSQKGEEKLGFIEAERIIAILEETTEKLSFLDSINPDILQHRDELSKFIGDEISRTLIEQKSLERKYEDLIEQRAAMKGMVNKHKYKEIQEEIQDVSRSLRESTNNLVRSLKENPNISGNLIKVRRDRTELNDVLLRCIQELRDRGRYTTVTHKVDEENHIRVRFQQLKSREKTLRETVAKLNETLGEEQKTFQHTAADQRQAIVQLKDELLSVKGSTSTDSRFRRRESLASVSAIWREYKHKEHQLEVRLKELEDKLHTENVVNAETKEFIMRKQSSLKDTLTEWEEKYETEVNKIDSELGQVTTKRNNLLEKLTALQERRKSDLLEEEKQEAALLAQREAEKQAKNRKKLENRAARTLQRELRGFLKRKKELDALKGDGKKKKGGKDKKGKKK